MKTVADSLQNCKAGFYPIVSFDPAREKLRLLDFTKQYRTLRRCVNDTLKFTDYINLKLKIANANSVSGVIMSIVHCMGAAKCSIQSPAWVLRNEQPTALLINEDGIEPGACTWNIWGRSYPPLHPKRCRLFLHNSFTITSTSA